MLPAILINSGKVNVNESAHSKN